MTGLLIAGTTSDAGKSLIVTGLARAFRRRGIKVAPFKSQNMSNNSMVCSDGTEIGRAQYLQAQAAGVEPSSLLNPVLLKPGSDRRSFVVLRGRPAGELGAGEYASGRKHLAEAAFDAYEELAACHDLVLCEGAGSPAEINLRRGDYVNFGLAERFGLPVVLAADIDRGGALAAIFGTHGIVSEQDRERLVGYLINKFRGDQAVLDPGLDELTRRTGLRNYGVLPWLADVWLDGEDALTIGSRALRPGTGVLHVAVVHFPRTSNATDVDALAAEPGVQVVVTASPDQVVRADLAVLPGSRATVTDLAWLREKGLAEAIRNPASSGPCSASAVATRCSPTASSTTSNPVTATSPAWVCFPARCVSARRRCSAGRPGPGGENRWRATPSTTGGFTPPAGRSSARDNRSARPSGPCGTGPSSPTVSAGPSSRRSHG